MEAVRGFGEQRRRRSRRSDDRGGRRHHRRGDRAHGSVRRPGDGTRVQYLDADEWYQIDGSPLGPASGSGQDLHEQIVQAVRHGLPDGLAALHPTT